MRLARALLATAAISALSACGIAGLLKTPPPPVATPKPTLVAMRGIAMPLHTARAGVSFRPFVPARELVDVALLAPYAGNDTRANRGIGFEYESGGRLFVLSQWPAHGTPPAGGTPLRPEAECSLTRYKPDGIIWTTKRDIVATLQTDGKSSPSAVETEARRLVRRGACR
jgi:predicted small lipoprotein YifL